MRRALAQSSDDGFAPVKSPPASKQDSQVRPQIQPLGSAASIPKFHTNPRAQSSPNASVLFLLNQAATQALRSRIPKLLPNGGVRIWDGFPSHRDTLKLFPRDPACVSGLGPGVEALSVPAEGQEWGLRWLQHKEGGSILCLGSVAFPSIPSSWNSLPTMS